MSSFKNISIKNHFAVVNAEQHAQYMNVVLTDMEAKEAREKLRDAMYVGDQEDQGRKRLISAIYTVEKQVKQAFLGLVLRIEIPTEVEDDEYLDESEEEEVDFELEN